MPNSTLPPIVIDPGSPVPKHYQLREILLELIERDLAVDAGIPSERELCQRYGMARMTVRHAIDHLVAEGRLYRVPGKGTFVARPKIDLPLRLESYSDDMRARGLQPGAVELSSRVVAAGATLARELRVELTSPVQVIERLRTADGEPMALERAHIPADAAPGLVDEDLSGRSLYSVLEERYGIVFDAGEQRIGAGIATAADAELLTIPSGSAVLLLQRRSSVAGRPVEYSVTTYRADRYQLHAALELPRRAVPATTRGGTA